EGVADVAQVDVGDPWGPLEGHRLIDRVDRREGPHATSDLDVELDLPQAEIHLDIAKCAERRDQGRGVRVEVNEVKVQLQADRRRVELRPDPTTDVDGRLDDLRRDLNRVDNRLK